MIPTLQPADERLSADCERIGFSGGRRSIAALVTPMRVDGILVWEALDALTEYESLEE